MPIFRVKSVKIYTCQKNLHWRRRPRRRQLSGMKKIIHSSLQTLTGTWSYTTTFINKTLTPTVSTKHEHQTWAPDQSTQTDRQCLNFAKKWFIQYSIQHCCAHDSIQNIIQFQKNSPDSIQKIIQFNSQGIIDTGWMGKVPKNCPKSVQNRQK